MRRRRHIFCAALLAIGADIQTVPLASADSLGTDDVSSLNGCLYNNPPPHSPAARSVRGGVQSALFFGATTDYAHGVLGDAIEAQSLLVQLRNGPCTKIDAGDNRVFEDVSPRLADLNMDGFQEIIVVASHQSFGARLEVYGFPAPDEAMALIGHTGYIGQRNRWLAPIGVADLDGDGHIELAYVDRPHLAKTIRIWRFRNGQLEPVADLPGFTNHRIGERDIAGGMRTCKGIPQMIVATADWTRLVAVQFVDGKFTTKDIGPHKGRASFAKAMKC